MPDPLTQKSMQILGMLNIRVLTGHKIGGMFGKIFGLKARSKH